MEACERGDAVAARRMLSSEASAEVPRLQSKHETVRHDGRRALSTTDRHHSVWTMINQVRRTVPCAWTVIVVSVIIIIVDAAALLGLLAAAFAVGGGGAAFVSLFGVETCCLGTVPQLRHVIM